MTPYKCPMCAMPEEERTAFEHYVQKQRASRDTLAERFKAAGLIRCAKPRPPGYPWPYQSEAEYHKILTLMGCDPLIIEYWVEEF